MAITVIVAARESFRETMDREESESRDQQLLEEAYIYRTEKKYPEEAT